MLAMTSEGEWVCDQSYVIYLQLQTTDTRCNSLVSTQTIRGLILYFIVVLKDITDFGVLLKIKEKGRKSIKDQTS